MKKTYEHFELSARSYHKLLKIARTIADMDDSREISLKHLKEAVYYKSINQQYWSGIHEV